jgi:chloramphenicol-sensitive protein RarD
VWAISVDRIVDTSLAYYINPLISVLFGVLLLGERMRRLQWIAVGLAAVGVAYLTIRLGVVPWLSLAMAASFAVYGLFKKLTPEADAFHGLAIETSWLAVGSFGMIVWWNMQGVAVFPAADITDNFLMVLTGVVTVIPLWLFGRAAHLIPLSTLGVLQYLAPTISLLVGVFLYGEQLAGDRLIGFMLVWVALAVFAYDSVKSLKAA